MSESVGWVEWARSYVTQERIQNALGWAQQNVPEYEALKSAASKTMSGQISMQPSTSTQGQTWSAWAWDMASPYVPGNRPPPGPPAVATNPEPIDSFQRYIPLLAHYWYISIPAGCKRNPYYWQNIKCLRNLLIELFYLQFFIMQCG